MNSFYDVLLDTEGEYTSYNPALWTMDQTYGVLVLPTPEGKMVKEFLDISFEKFGVERFNGKTYGKFNDVRLSKFLVYHVEYAHLFAVSRWRCDIRGYIDETKVDGFNVLVCTRLVFRQPADAPPTCPLVVHQAAWSIMCAVYPFTWLLQIDAEVLQNMHTVIFDLGGLKTLGWSRSVSYGKYFKTKMPAEYYYFLSGRDTAIEEQFTDTTDDNKEKNDQPKCVEYTFPPVTTEQLAALHKSDKQKYPLSPDDIAEVVLYANVAATLDSTVSLVVSVADIIELCYNGSWFGKRFPRDEDEMGNVIPGTIFEDAMNNLVLNNLLYRDDKDMITLVEIDTQMVGIIECLWKLFDQFPWETLSREDIYHKISSLGLDLNKLCDEQMEMIVRILTRPVVMVDGRAGSGKTSGIMQLYECISRGTSDTKFQFTAFQANTVDILSDKFPNNSRTMDSTLYKHKDCRRDGSEPCIFSELENVIIDESSTLYPCLLYRFLKDVSMCSKCLKSLIFIGDRYQIPPIQKGDVIKPVFNILSKFNAACNFEHNHRVRSEIIAHNARMVIECAPNRLKTKTGEFETVPVYSRENIVETVIQYIKAHELKEYQFEIITGTWKISNDLATAVENYYNELDYLGASDWRVVYKGRKIVFKKNYAAFNIKNNGILIVKDILDVKYVFRSDIGQDKNRENLLLRHCMMNYGIPVTNEDKLQQGIEVLSSKSLMSTSDEKSTHQFGTFTRRWLICSKLRAPDQISHIIPWNSYWVKMNCRKAGSCTINSFQGSGIDTVLYVIPTKSTWEKNEDVETAITRSINKFVYFGATGDLVAAVKRPNPVRLSNLEWYAEKRLFTSVPKWNTRIKFLPIHPDSNDVLKRLAIDIKNDLTLDIQEEEVVVKAPKRKPVVPTVKKTTKTRKVTTTVTEETKDVVEIN